MEIRVRLLLCIVLGCLSLPASAGKEGLDPKRAYRGTCFVSSSIGKEVSLSEVGDFVTSCRFDLVVIDFAWITHHWPRTDFAAVERIASALKRSGVEVVALYRPRALNPADAKVHYAKDARGRTARSHNSLCLAHEDSVAWGAKWGSDILRRMPSVDKVALYNLASPCACRDCRGGRSGAHVAAFLKRCRAEWSKVRPQVRIGHVGVSDEFEGGLDFFMPFVMVNRPAADAPAVDAAALLKGARSVKARHPSRAVLPFAKTCWTNETRNTASDVVATIAEAGRRRTGLVLWYHEWLFHDEDRRYDARELVRALGGDWGRLKRYCAKPAAKEKPHAKPPAKKKPGSRAGSPNFFYFKSRQSNGGGPKLRLVFRRTIREVPATKDTTLISYLPKNVMGGVAQLAVSLDEKNQVLIAFDMPKRIQRRSLRGAVLELDMKTATSSPVTVPFELVVHAVTSEWSEATSWSTKPTFDPNPAKTIKVKPKAQTLRIELTNLVKSWIGREGSNHGVLLKVAEPTRDPGRPVPQPKPQPTPQAAPKLTYPFDERRIEKLPWPHQAPDLDRNQASRLDRDVWIINDFPLYQGDEKGQWRYFHGGLDIVLDNGTRIYSMKDGYVKAIKGSSIVIADKKGDEPCYGWSYAHLGDHRVRVGEFVRSGTVIGAVEFEGLAHIHLEKVFSEGRHWGEWHYICVPNGHFTYVDEDPPVIETPFLFFRNGSDDRIEPERSGEVRLSGEVDIVVAMREAGRYAHSEGGFGDRLGVMRTDYEIERFGGGKKHFRSFDFNVLKFRKGYYGRAHGTELTKVVYKHYGLCETGKRGGNKVFSYYVITNCRGDAPPRKIDPEDRKYAWNTAAKDRMGRPLYPNGPYRITVRARDFDGNEASASMSVTVANGR